MADPEPIHIDPMTGKVIQGISKAAQRDFRRGTIVVFQCYVCKTTFFDESSFLAHKSEKNHNNNSNDTENVSNSTSPSPNRPPENSDNLHPPPRRRLPGPGKGKSIQTILKNYYPGQGSSLKKILEESQVKTRSKEGPPQIQKKLEKREPKKKVPEKIAPIAAETTIGSPNDPKIARGPGRPRKDPSGKLVQQKYIRWGPNMVRCTRCDIDIHFKQQHRHDKSFHGYSPKNCGICGKTLQTQCMLLKHEKKHMGPGNKGFRCPYPNCSKILASKSSVRNHIQSFHKPGEFKCMNCLKVFKTQQNMNTHNTKFHMDVDHICPTCGKKYSNKDNLKRHIRNIHNLLLQ